MAELPKIVKGRLAQQSSADQAHPDANLLAAFAEQALLERERAEVSAHLAHCADCRESLALASLPQEVTPVEDRAAATKRHWFLEWRWVGAAAAACCVIGVALQYGVQPFAVERTRYSVAPPAGAAPAPLPAQPSRQMAAALKLKVEHSKKAVQLPPPSSLAQEQSPPSVVAPMMIRPVEPPAPSEQANNLLSSRIEPKAATLQKDIAAFRAQSGASAQALGRSMVARAPLTAGRTVSGVWEPAALWSISAAPGSAGKARGVVERSLDSGKTWEVAALGDDVSFRAVASAGLNVWAGGTGGALFHSADGGAHWEQIAVIDNGARLTGTIVNIDARDANLIRITTNSGEKWFSSDGGRRWERQ